MNNVTHLKYLSSPCDSFIIQDAASWEYSSGIGNYAMWDKKECRRASEIGVLLNL